jgi:hypothetical protein
MTPKFPAIVQGTNGDTVSKANGVYTIGPDYDTVTAVPSVSNEAIAYARILDHATGQYHRMSLTDLKAQTPGTIEVLAGNRTYDVTPGGPYPTLQAAWDASTKVDANGFSIFIQCHAGTDTTGLVAYSQARNAANIIIQGDNVNPTNCKITTTNQSAMQFSNGIRAIIDGFQLSTITSGNSLYVRSGSNITVGSIQFGSCSPGNVNSSDVLCEGGQILFTQSYTKSGDTGDSHHHVFSYGLVSAANITITQVGTPVYGGYFAGIANGLIAYAFTTFTGACTGRKYYVHFGGTIFTSGQDLPGSIAGNNLGGNIDDRIAIGGTNDSNLPVFGQVGERVTSTPVTGGSLALTTSGTAYTVGFIDLQPGIWDVQAVGEFTQANTTVVTSMQTSISDSAAFDNTIGRYASVCHPAGSVLGFGETTMTTPNVRIAVARGNTHRVYHVSSAFFSVSTMAGGGVMWAHRHC